MKKSLLILLFTTVISLFITNNVKAQQDGLFIYEIEDNYAIITDCNTELKDIYVPKTLDGYTVSKIDMFCFSDCKNMETIFLPDTITCINAFAFSDSTKLKDVYFSGTESQWESIIIDIFNENLTNAEIHYNYTNLDVDSVTYNGFTVQNNVLVAYTDNKTKVDIPQSIKGHSILSIGKTAFNNNNQIEILTIPEGVTYIDASAFQRCGNLKTITLPESLEYVGDYAFAFCTNLAEIQLPSKITIINPYTFSDCNNLNNVYLGCNIEKISTYAFNYCYNLSQIYYNGSQSDWQNVVVEEPGNGFFIKCVTDDILSGPIFSNGELTETLTWNFNSHTLTIKGSGNMPDWTSANWEFDPWSPPWYIYADKIEKVVIDEGVTNIGAWAFKECCNMRSIEISDTVSKIGNYAFHQCLKLSDINLDSSNPYFCCIDQVIYSKERTNLIYYAAEKMQKEFHIPDTVRIITNGAFNHNQHLVDLYLNNGIATLCANTVYNCSALSSISIPETVNDISGTFTVDCVSLSKYTVSSANSLYTSCDGVIFNKNKTKIIKYPQGKTDAAYIIPPETRIIGNSAFDYCHNIISMYIPDGVTTIDEGAFSYCDNLRNIYIPPTVTEIESHMVLGCTKLSDVIFLSKVDSMGVEAFYDCYSLKNIYYGGSQDQWKRVSEYSGVEYIEKLSVQYNKATTPIVSAIIDEKDTETLFSILTCNIPKNSLITIALYNNNQLSDIKLFNSDIQYKLHESSFAYDKIKVMVWDNAKSLKPLSAPIIR